MIQNWLIRAARLWCGLVIAAIFFFAGLGAANAGDAQYYYDSGGRLTGAVDTTGVAQYTYDKSGNIKSVVRSPLTTLTVLQASPGGATVGSTVTIAGTAFGTPANTTVKFNGVTATLSSVTSTLITATIPSGTNTGPITVTAPSGSVTTTWSFTILAAAAPTITSFTTGTSTPNIASVGDTLTVSGTKFDTSFSKFTVNGQYALVSGLTHSSATLVVPPASSGKIAVETTVGTAVSSSDLIVAPPSFAPSAVTYGRLTIDTPPITIPHGGAGTVGLAIFDAAPGQKVTLHLDDTHVPGCPTISFLTPSGAPFLTPLPGSMCAVQFWTGPFVISQAGTYTIALAPTSTAGSFGAQVFSVPQDPVIPVTIGGSAQTLTIAAPGQNGSFTFSGTAGQKISILLNFSGMGSVCSSYALQNPDKSFLVTLTHTCANGIYINSPFVLAQTGTYTISIVPDLGGTGPITAQLFSVPPDITQPVSIGGSSAALNFVAPGQHGTFTFSGTAGQRVSLLLDFSGMGSTCSNYTVINPDTSVLFGPTDTCANGLYVNSPFVLPQTGTYTIALIPSLSGGTPTSGTGTITAQLFSVPPDLTVPLTIGGSAALMTFTVPGQAGKYTFSGTSGQHYTINLDFSGMGSSCSSFSVLNPDGSTLYGPINGTCANFYSTGSLLVSQTGTFSVAITPSLSGGTPTSGTGTDSATGTNP